MTRRRSGARAVLAAAAVAALLAVGGTRAEAEAGIEAGIEAGVGAPSAADGAAEPAAAAERRGPVTNLPLPRYVSLRAQSANARRGPSLSHRVDWEFVRRGWPLQITAEYGHWRRVRDVEGAGGWMHHSLLSGVRTVVVTGSELVPLNVTRSEASAVRAYVEPGVVARLEGCEADWCRVSVERADGWARRDTLWGTD